MLFISRTFRVSVWVLPRVFLIVERAFSVLHSMMLWPRLSFDKASAAAFPLRIYHREQNQI